MPTKREREYYRMGFADGRRFEAEGYRQPHLEEAIQARMPRNNQWYDTPSGRKPYSFADVIAPKKRKLSAWNKYVKNKRNHIKYRDGKLNLKKMAVAFRRKRRR